MLDEYVAFLTRHPLVIVAAAVGTVLLLVCGVVWAVGRSDGTEDRAADREWNRRVRQERQRAAFARRRGVR